MINVLLVEDELLARSGMKALIDWNTHGFHLAGEASHGGEALEILQRQPIDIVITDIRMPVMDGLQLIEQIRERNLPCEIIVLSSFDDFHYVRKAMTHGVRDYIHKPTMNMDEFIDTLKRVAQTLASRTSAEHYERLIQDVVEESRTVVLRKIVDLALQQEQADEKLQNLVQGTYVAKESFWVGALRYGRLSHAAPTHASAESRTPDQTLHALVREQATHNAKPVFMFQADPVWLFLFAAEQQDWMPLLASRLEERHSVDAIWEMPGSPCTLDRLPTVLPETLSRLNSRYEQLEKQRTPRPLIKKVLEYIAIHYADNLTLEKVSSVVHVSPAYLSRLFYKETGETFVDCLTRVRVEQAKRLLRETDLLAYEIADRVGYGNSKYFLRVFKRLEGITPGEFRDRERTAGR